MLMNIRDKVSGWLGWLVIVLIVAAFSLFGIGYYIQDSTRNYAAKVNDVEIPVTRAQRVYHERREQIRNQLGDRFNPDTFDEAGLRKQSLESLINNEVLYQAVTGAHFAVSDNLLAARLQSTSYFQEDGKFSPERYRTLLKRQGMRPAQYEGQVIRELVINQLRDGIALTRGVPESAATRLLRIQGQTRSIKYFVIPAHSLESEVKVSEEDIKAFFEKHGDEFVEPEKVKLSYIELGARQDLADLDVDEQEVEKRYQERVNALKDQEERRARHILIQVSRDAPEADVDAARKKADAALTRLRNGEDFATVAKELSDDSASAAEGGDLGFFAKGLMVPEFDQTVFAMKKGEISEPVRSDFGFHVIQLEDIKAKEIPQKADIRDELAKEVRESEAEEEYLENIEELSNLVFENPDSLDPAADQLGLKIEKSDWLTRNGTGSGVLANRKVLSAAFSEDVLLQGNNSEVIELPDKRAIVLRVEEHQAPKPRSLDDVHDSIRSRLLRQGIRDKALERAQAYVSELDQGNEIGELAKQAGSDLVTPEPLTRSEREVDPAILRETFQLPKPSGDAPVNGVVTTLNGDAAVIQLSEVIDPVVTDIPEETLKAVRTNLETILGRRDGSVMIDDLRSKAVIDIREYTDQ